jgi:hypothetical protein
MNGEPRAPRLAVLIDAENTSARIVQGLFEEIAKIGEASVRRIYGDFSDTRLKAWVDVLATHAIMPHQNFAYTSGKNAADIALVIDAMDLLHGGLFDGFCLVSSDSDFTRLAARIREQGVDVYGFGEQKTPTSFVRACRRFVYTENLAAGAPGSDHPEQDRIKAAPKPVANATSLIRTAIAQLESDDGWVSLSRIGARLSILTSDFDARNYGQPKLVDLVSTCGAFDVRRNDRNEVFVRAKPKPGKAGSSKPKPAPKK